MADPTSAPDWRGALVGAMISGVFGLGWSQWGASGLTGASSGAVRIAGVVVGLLIVVWCARLRQEVPRVGGARPIGASGALASSMFASPRYLLVVALEVVAIGGGNAVLGATGHSDYAIAWTATIVGVHFLGFGRLFFAGFYWLGTALIAAGIAGAIVGLAGGGVGAIAAVSGLLAATSLFVASGWTIMGARAGVHV